MERRLHERWQRRDDDLPVNFSQIRRPGPLQTDVNRRFSLRQSQPTTPPTASLLFDHKQSPNQRLPDEQQPIFHNYLRAQYKFDPPTDSDNHEEALLLTAPIRPGDLILVHSVHTNGWADGTVLTTGARGWVPTNYCEAFDHPYVRNLLGAMTQFWDLLTESEEANLSAFVRQDYVRGLIAGVRYLLEQADCLHRDAPLVLRCTGIRRMRKGLLADLTALLDMAKRLQETVSEAFAEDVMFVLLEDIMAKALKVVTRAVGFLDMLAQEGTEISPRRRSARLRSESTGTFTGRKRLSVDTRAKFEDDSQGRMDSAKHFQSTANVPSSPAEGGPKQGALYDMESPVERRRSAVYRPRSGVVAQRLSYTAQQWADPAVLASQQLDKAHGECISQIGAFIGLYMHSRPASELVATTERLVKACKAMLKVVDQVAARDSLRAHMLEQARLNFQSKLDELTRSTRCVFKFSDEPDDDVVMLPEQTNHLVNVGTGLIRTVGECVVKTRKIIDQVGDFELDLPLMVENQEEEEQATTGAERSATPRQTGDVVQKGMRSPLAPIMPPSPPPSPPKQITPRRTEALDFAHLSPLGATKSMVSPIPFLDSLQKPLPAPPSTSPTAALSPAIVLRSDAAGGRRPSRDNSASPPRKVSFGLSISGSTETRTASFRDSGITTVSEVSTRATTPDHLRESGSADPRLANSFGSLSSLRSADNGDAGSDVEALLLRKTYANELTLNKDGQVTGGSLPALVERLTTADAMPDAHYVAAFFTTFRSFTTPLELTQALVHRFDYVGEDKADCAAVRLRICNVFKTWLESYWNNDADKDVLDDIRDFALNRMKAHLPSAGERLAETSRRVAESYRDGGVVTPLISPVSKTTASLHGPSRDEMAAPEPVLTKAQLTAMRTASSDFNATCTILDFDALEVARQLTILASNVFCEIQASELLSLEWTKKDTSRARNIRSMCALNTDLAHAVNDTLLTLDDNHKKRAQVIKYWSKVATHCLELNNYDSLMAIVCSLNSSSVQRLKKTWELISKKTRARLDELNTIVDFSRNHISLRRRLDAALAPCLPFLGVYLTDLTFADAGNPKFREIPVTTSTSTDSSGAAAAGLSIINFDKYMKMYNIVSTVQRFQVPYKLESVPEMQDWIHTRLERMREGQAQMVGNFHRRSLFIEPKRDPSSAKAVRSGEGKRGWEVTVTEEQGNTALAAAVGTNGKAGKMHGQGFDFGALKTSFAFSKNRAVVTTLPDVVEEV